MDGKESGPFMTISSPPNAGGKYWLVVHALERPLLSPHAAEPFRVAAHDSPRRRG